jgi:oligopeptidase A
MTQAFQPADLPQFNHIDPKKIEPVMQDIITQNKTKMAALLQQSAGFTWDNLLKPMEEMSDELSKAWSPISHLHGVLETDELRVAYNKVLPLLTEYHMGIAQNETLFLATQAIKDSQSFANLNPAQRKMIDNDLRDYKLAGVNLPQEKKLHFAELQKQLSSLMTKFAENVLDATHHYYLHVENETDIQGLPEQAKELAKENAANRDLTGYVFTLDYPSYSTAMKFLQNRELRRTLYEAYTTRASDRGPDAEKWNNTSVMEDILQIRHDMAQLVGFNNYAEYSLATKMAKTPEEVIAFLDDLFARSKPIAQQELAEIKTLAKKCDDLDDLQAWDIAYYSERLQQDKFNFTQEDCRPYFPIDRVINGLFSLMHQIYGLTITEEKQNVWHPDVKFYVIYDKQNNLRGGFYTDLYARAHKRDGAWMDDCRTRCRLDQHTQYPVAYLTCNFMPPAKNKPALLTHDDVLTLFHEFGHCLHHILTQVNYPSVAGINGVAWDAVEFPSQFLENFCWEIPVLNLIAKHYQTGEPFPEDLLQKMLAAKYFQTGLQMIRQLEFALFDFLLHLNYDPKQKNQVQDLLNRIRKQEELLPIPEFNRFQHSFSHIFAGSYAAGYYSYKWAEVLSADAYAKFEENGIFDTPTGISFMQNILEVGGVRDPMDSFIAFRGRKPSIDALLKQSGMTL